MMLLAIAALLQTAQPGPPPPAADTPIGTAASGAPVPAPIAAGRVWSGCVKSRIDARTPSSDAAETVADGAMAACTRELEAVRTAIAAERGAEIAAANVERINTSGRAMFIAYIATRRSAATPAPSAATGR